MHTPRNASTTTSATETGFVARRRGARRGMQATLVATALAVALSACGTVGPSSVAADDAGSTPATATGDGPTTPETVVVRARTRTATDKTTVGATTGPAKLLVNRNSQNPNPMVSGNDWADMSEFMSFVIHDADSYWTPTLIDAGLPEPQVRYALPAPGEVLQTGCSMPTDDTSMFYCPTDDTIYFSQDLARNLWNGTYVGPDGQQITGPGGDMAPAIMLAHEFAHSIQTEVGLTSTQFGVARIEKHADCWAGVWAQNAASRGVLDPGDVQEAVNTAFLVGDSHFDSPTHHGTSAERVEAFQIGFGASSPSDCDVYLTS